MVVTKIELIEEWERNGGDGKRCLSDVQCRYYTFKLNIGHVSIATVLSMLSIYDDYDALCDL